MNLSYVLVSVTLIIITFIITIYIANNKVIKCFTVKKTIIKASKIQNVRYKTR